MQNTYFQSLEKLNKGQTVALKQAFDELLYDDKELIPVITQDAITKQVLMMAWMNRESLEHTLSTGRMTYWSRSRPKLWIKGETSGHFQTLESMRLDCDGDAVLCLVKQSGVACHTGRDNCFYLEVDKTNNVVEMLNSPP